MVVCHLLVNVQLSRARVEFRPNTLTEPYTWAQRPGVLGGMFWEMLRKTQDLRYAFELLTSRALPPVASPSIPVNVQPVRQQWAIGMFGSTTHMKIR